MVSYGHGKSLHSRRVVQPVAVFNARGLDFAIELGDFMHFTRDREGTLACLDAIEASFAKFAGPRYHVAGNHDFDCLSPEEFFSRVPNDGQISRTGYYSFVRGGRFAPPPTSAWSSSRYCRTRTARSSR